MYLLWAVFLNLENSSNYLIIFSVVMYTKFLAKNGMGRVRYYLHQEVTLKQMVGLFVNALIKFIAQYFIFSSGMSTT
jgi:hypothetical protein